MKHNERIKALSLKWKLVMFFALFAVFILVLLWFFQIVFLDDFYKAIKTGQIKSYVDTVRDDLESDNLADTVLEVCKKYDVEISVYDTTSLKDGGKSADFMLRYFDGFNTVITDDQLSALTGWMISDEGTSYYELASENGGSYFSTDVNQPNAKQFIFRGSGAGEHMPPQFSNQRDENHGERMTGIVIAEGTDGTEYMIIIESMITPVTSTVSTLRIQLSIVTAIVLLFGAILAFFAAKHLSRPIVKINSSAKELSRGDYTVVFDGKGYKEIAELNSTLNYTVGELAKVEHLRRELIANISHDLRTPLTMISGYAEVMRDVPGEKTNENIQTIIDEATRLNTLVSDLMDISKLQSGVMTLTTRRYNLTSSIRQIFERYTRLIEKDNFNIFFEADRDVYISADEVKMAQVIYNLINNAINYCGEDKMVIVRQTFSGGQVKIEVIDHGVGIEPDKLNLIWDRYYKSDKTHLSEKIGTGLGLSIVKSVLTLHKSSFGVISEPGKGSCFWFVLNADEEQDAT